MDPVFFPPTFTPLYHPHSYYCYYYSNHPHNFYCYPPQLHNVTSSFLPYPQSNHSQPFSFTLFDTQQEAFLPPQPQPQPTAPVVTAAEGYFGKKNSRRVRGNHGVRLCKKKLTKGKQKWVAKKSEHANEGGSQSQSQSQSQSDDPPPPPSSAPQLDGCTTVMVKNIPNSLSRRDLINMLDRHCRELNSTAALNPCPFQFDFLYLPFDFASKQNLGYGFVNFTTVQGAEKLHKCWSGRGWERCHKILEITPAKLQGLEKCKKHFEVSSFYCHSEEYLPVVFWPPRDGLNGGVCNTLTIGKLAHHHVSPYNNNNNNDTNNTKSGWDKVKRAIPPRLRR